MRIIQHYSGKIYIQVCIMFLRLRHYYFTENVRAYRKLKINNTLYTSVAYTFLLLCMI